MSKTNREMLSMTWDELGKWFRENEPTWTQEQGKRSGYKKVNIPNNIRWEVWERDNFTCQICGSRKNLAVDHIHPERKGGTLDLTNLQTLCKSCNSRKGAK